MKYCIQCKYAYKLPRTTSVLCTHPDTRDVVGFSQPALDVRQFGKCGEDATLFEQKPPPPPPWWRLLLARRYHATPSKKPVSYYRRLLEEMKR